MKEILSHQKKLVELCHIIFLQISSFLVYCQYSRHGNASQRLWSAAISVTKFKQAENETCKRLRNRFSVDVLTHVWDANSFADRHIHNVQLSQCDCRLRHSSTLYDSLMQKIRSICSERNKTKTSKSC